MHFEIQSVQLVGNGIEEITIDELRRHGLKVMQPVHGYRFSLDPILLSNFTRVGEGDRIADLGTGCGIIPLLLTRQKENATIVGIEFQDPMAALAQRNVSLNQLDDRISIISEDVVNLKRHFPVSTFDLVVSNPPYRRPGTGKISPQTGRDRARHESTASLADFMAVSKYLVKPSGRICFIHHPSRLVELMSQAAAMKLAPIRLRMIHGHSKAEAGMFLVELVKGRTGDLVVEPPLVVFGDGGGYNDEVQKMMEA